MGRRRYVFLIISIYLFAFEFALMKIHPIFGYWDELYAMMAIPLFLAGRKEKRVHRTASARIVILVTLYIIIGILSNIISGYQSIAGIVTDILLQLKFFFGIATTFYLFRNVNIDLHRRVLKRHIKLLLSILLSLVLIDKMANIYPKGDGRFGLSSEMLFFGHPTGLASVSFFLMLMIMLLYDRRSRDFLFVVIGAILVLSTLRFKAIAAVVTFGYIYFITVVRKKRVTGKRLMPFIPIAVWIGWDEFYGYYLSPTSIYVARGALFHTGLSIAKKYFPFGTGFGTFASDPSGKYYSAVYRVFGINDVWGLSPENASLVSDTFWPMVLGQTGFLGIVIYILIVFYLFRLIKPAELIDKGLYTAGVGAIVYLLFSSIAESAFVNPLALPLAFIIGLVVCRIRQEQKRGSE